MEPPDKKLVLKPCPLCGKPPRRGLGKVQYCSLHGDPYQHYNIWCDNWNHCIKVTAVDAELAADEWNTRHPD
jgi:hypothetical protein